MSSSYSQDRYDVLGKKAEAFAARVLMDEWGADKVRYTGPSCYTHDFEVTAEVAGVPHIFTFEVKAQHAAEESGFITLMWAHPTRITLSKCDADYYLFVTHAGLFQVRASALKTLAQDQFDCVKIDRLNRAVQFWPREDGSMLVGFDFDWLRRKDFCSQLLTKHRNPLAPETTRHLKAVN